MRFEVLGPIRVVGEDGRPAEVAGPGLRALLVLLLLEPGATVSAERLIDALHGEDPPPGALQSLHSQVSRLRKLGVAVELRPSGYRIAAEAGDVDAHRFERLAEDGRRALEAGEHRRALALLEEALGLWRGPAPEQLATHMEDVWLGAMEDRFEAGGGSVAEMRALLAEHPLRERLCGLLMRALIAQGRQAEALTAFEHTRGVLAEELGADPSPTLAEIHLAILRGAEPVKRGIRAQLTSFVGRQDDVRSVRELLLERRLVTLTGPGGVGKTRLAAETAAGFDGEVCFAELAHLSDGRELPQLLLGALGVRETALSMTRGPAPEDRLAAALHDRDLVLVVDNCEHVVEAVAHLTDRLLASCPGIRVLATSREPLGITGERLFPVGPLPEAVALRLLRDRAAAVRPDLAAGEDVLLRICRALDGLPLAIELAAARLRFLDAEEVADRLDDRFRLLTGGSRTALPRHRTLRAVVAWSWDLLEEPERVFARRFAVFARGATLEAAEHVCAGDAWGGRDALEGRDALDLLAALVDKSLIEVACGRYRMLETIRAFCAERLAEAGEEERLREDHADHFIAFAQRADAELRGRDQLVWLPRVTAENDEMQAALRWAIDAGHSGRALRLVAGLWWYWVLRGLRLEGYAFAEDALGMVGWTPPRGLETEYVLCVLVVASVRNPGRAVLDQLDLLARALTREPGDPIMMLVRPLVAMLEGVIGAEDEDLLRATTSSDPWTRALARLFLGFARLSSGQVAAAEREFTRALDGFAVQGDGWAMAQALLAISEPQGWRGEHAAAMETIEQAMELVGRLGSAEDRATVLCHRAAEWLRAGDVEAAAADCEEAFRLARLLDIPEIRILVRLSMANVARASGRTAEAAELYELALGDCGARWGGVEQFQTRILVGLGRTAESQGDLGTSLRRHREAFDLAAGTGDRPSAALAAEGLASLTLTCGDAGRAALLLGTACALRGLASVDPDTAATVTLAREALGDPGYEEAYRRGAEMTSDEALTALTRWTSAPGPLAVRALAHRGGHDNASD
ncbi:ATP-binding protein [Streptosporangium sp. NPDC000396]|uniref:ATP-binding protein n=1 Tax=Streptosporangium sp. NPDC000396 TaxID=3366185 RepID=UPI003690084B